MLCISGAEIPSQISQPPEHTFDTFMPFLLHACLPIDVLFLLRASDSSDAQRSIRHRLGLRKDKLARHVHIKKKDRDAATAPQPFPVL